MKCPGTNHCKLSNKVTLCVRVWIEIAGQGGEYDQINVTLCVRVWIEMSQS